MASPKACSSRILKLWFFARSTSEVGGGKFVPKPHVSNFSSVFSVSCFLKETNFRQTLPEIACSLLAEEVQRESEQGSPWNQMFAPCREQTGNPSHKLRRYLGSLFKSRLHYASAGEESLVRFATHIPGDDVGWVCWKRLEGYERDVSNRVRLLSCRVVNLTDGCCFQQQLGRSSNTESWIVSRVIRLGLVIVGTQFTAKTEGTAERWSWKRPAKPTRPCNWLTSLSMC